MSEEQRELQVYSMRTQWKNWKREKKDGICQKELQQNLHDEHNFLKHTIIIYPHYENSMIKNLSENQNTQKIQSYFLGTTKQSASLGCTAPIDQSIKWHNLSILIQ